MKKVIWVLSVLCLLLLLTVVSAETARVATGGGTLNMRVSPEDGAKLVMRIKNHTDLEAESPVNGWCHVLYKGHEGYVKAQYLRFASEVSGKEVFSDGETLYLRSSPSDGADIVEVANAQSKVTVLSVSDGWAEVSSGEVSGYVPVSQVMDQNMQPAGVAKQIPEAGTVIKKAKVYASPDTSSPTGETLPKGTEVIACSYDKNWALVKVSGRYVYVKKDCVKLSPMQEYRDLMEELAHPEPKEEEANQPKLISADQARSIAAKSLKGFSGFSASKLDCNTELYTRYAGMEGPLYRLVYMNKNGNCAYAACIHAVTGAVMAKEDHSSFAYGKNASDIKTAAPKPTRALATPAPGEISSAEARSIADAALASTYGSFASESFTSVSVTRYNSKPSYEGPFWQLNYAQEDGIAYIVMVHCVSGNVIYKNDVADPDLTEIDYGDPDPTWEPLTGPEMSEAEARSIADRYLASRYPNFSGYTFSKVNVRHESAEETSPAFRGPLYQFDYYIQTDGGRDELVYGVYINTITGEVEYTCGAEFNEGNG